LNTNSLQKQDRSYAQDVVKGFERDKCACLFSQSNDGVGERVGDVESHLEYVSDFHRLE